MAGDQIVLASKSSLGSFWVDNIEDESKDWLSATLLLSAATGLSLVVLLGQAIYYAYFSSCRTATARGAAEDNGSRFQTHVAGLGGPAIFAFKAARLVACLTLAGLTAISWMFAVFVYASLLSVVSIAGCSKWGKICSTHIVFVLLVPWALYMYRDIWPLATYTLAPADRLEGWLIWMKISVLSLAAVVIPLVIPRQHTPVDLEDVPEKPAPTDTASRFSMMVHSYSDAVIWKANKVPHLKLEDLPPLSDLDYTKNLVNRSYAHLDPLQTKKKWHIALSLIFNVFPGEHIEVALMLMLRVLTSFLAPLGINRLLNHLETGGEGAIVRPWVWMIWLLLGPLLSSIVFDWYYYRTTRIYVQATAIFTQLVFDHALRIRVKPEVPEAASANQPGSTAVSTPDNASVAEPNTTVESSETEDNEDGGSVAPSVATSATQVQQPAKKADGDKIESQTDKDKSGSSNNLVGKLNNLVTTDLATLQGGQNFMLLVFYIPMQIILSMVILHSMLGWSIYPGFAVMIATTPLPGYVAKLLRGVQADKMKKSDARVQSVTETMNVIRMVKLFGWEPEMSEQLSEKRQVELKAVRKLKLLQLLNGVANNLIPIFTMVITYGTYTVVMKQTLTASKVFSSMAIFEIIQEHFAGIFYIIPPLIQAKVSLDRISEFLNNTELLDKFTPKANTTSAGVINASEVEEGSIGIRSASFTWTVDSDGTTTPGSTRRKFTLRIEDELFFKRDCINLIIGQTGSGKTSLLMALLGEMHYSPAGPHSVVSLPRDGGVAYHAQESWVLNETIRDNILFGSAYDEERYNAVIEQCGLKLDLTLFNAGDQTEVGEKGLTLSGGQKARVTLARAVYSSAKILLLDDVLAALDVHTARWIVEKCLRGELLRGRTVILVTHNIALTAPIADFVVSLSLDGRVLSQGSLSSALAKDKKLQAEAIKERQVIEKTEETIEQPEIDGAPGGSNGKLIIEEEVAVGHIGWSALEIYLRSMQGRSGSFVFWTLFGVFMLISKVFSQLDVWVLGLWTSQYEHHDPSEVPVPYYLTLYTLTILIGFFGYAICYAIWVLGSIRASRRIHQLLIESVLGTTLRWLDKTPISRVITRCTQDIASIDGEFSSAVYQVIDVFLQIFMKFGAVIIISPIFSIPGLLVILMGFWFGHVYMRAQLPVKRESSNAKSPVLGHFNSAITGLVSIRAYGAQAAFQKESYTRIDRYSRAQVVYWNLNRWIGIRSSALAGVFAAGLAAYLIYGEQMDASTTGFSLTMAVGFSGMILWMVRLFNRAEVEGNSMERIQQYLHVEQEPKSTKVGEAPAYWPASGDLRVEGLSARYSANGPKVLHDITFHIKSGERVGIVGRTGSGKSSLTLALLRCIITEGSMIYDGLPTDSLNLDALRSNITIIPQVPELLSGTLRQNLDPFSQFDDAELNDALRAAGLFSIQSDDDETQITLDTSISGGGSNLSVGQRQILALARAIVRRSKLLILDEATSAIDYETDNIIQTSLRSKLDKDVTLLTVAHRLQTIMDADRIMVLDSGRIVEFDKPSELLKNERGFLRMLVDESGDKEKLFAMTVGTSADLS